jgi:hypothetical protein
MIIIDTNVLLAFLLTNGITRRIIVENPEVFMSPEYCFDELWEHRDRWNKNDLLDVRYKALQTGGFWRTHKGIVHKRCNQVISLKGMIVRLEICNYAPLCF